jgi:hypothetical protein
MSCGSTGVGWTRQGLVGRDFRRAGEEGAPDSSSAAPQERRPPGPCIGRRPLAAARREPRPCTLHWQEAFGCGSAGASPYRTSAFICSPGRTDCVEQGQASEYVQRPFAASRRAPRSRKSIGLLRGQCCGLNHEQSVWPLGRLSFARCHIVTGSASNSALIPTDPITPHNHPGRDPLGISIIEKVQSIIDANCSEKS